ncbi:MULTISPECIES: NERD domain-containing protein [Arthrobacter]|uniref:NERD domain-containing protein n=2 Tax=Arthrobacter TaxID=1663 RepID=A0ABU9KMC6_9MICC|nr:NERD domain-containing protein [Arthrobacter sp. YJM1]MDP5226708.1 NERD domain-containing protein [Arthrobacter sp. YJM1]
MTTPAPPGRTGTTEPVTQGVHIARSVPEEPLFGEGRDAERRVWATLLRQLPDDVVVCHSVQVRDGAAEHEIDLLVLWPGVGIACLEVKGGRVSVDGGQWLQADRNGKHRIASPVAQAQSAMHGFLNMVSQRLGTPLTSRIIYLGAFPYTAVAPGWEMAGTPRALILDEAELAGDALAERIRGAIHAEAKGHSSLAPPYAERLEQFIAGGLPDDDGAAFASGDPSASSEAEDAQERLTEKQQLLLTATRSLKHVRFVGGAGSGKTWLAVEKARRLAKAGKRVGLFCYNKGLGQHLARQVARWRHRKPVFTGEFHAFALQQGVPAGVGQEYFDAEMPRRLSELGVWADPADKFDAIVVDEAQDLAPSWWEALLSWVKEPARAEVYAFMDDRQDVYRRWDGADVAAVGDQVVTFAPIHVDENLRNSRRIAESFACFAGEGFTPRTDTGLPVRIVACAAGGEIGAADDLVDPLLEEGWAANQIALLTTKHRHPVHQEAYDGGDAAVAEYWRDFHDGRKVFYGHVLGIKGLERSVVILCMDGFKDMDRARELLYVGMSRARSLLVLVGDPDVIREAGREELVKVLAEKGVRR